VRIVTLSLLTFRECSLHFPEASTRDAPRYCCSVIHNAAVLEEGERRRSEDKVLGLVLQK
jgi:hypothetical protein